MAKKKCIEKIKKEDIKILPSKDYICNECKKDLILGKNVKIICDELVCRHKIKELLSIQFD